MTMINDIKKLLRSKKGAAIEMALFLMAIIFLFSTLITVFCLPYIRTSRAKSIK